MWAENLASAFEQVAQETGFATAAVMRHHFVRADIASLEAPGRRLIFSRLQDRVDLGPALRHKARGSSASGASGGPSARIAVTMLTAR
jgi:hypothetical protein